MFVCNMENIPVTQMFRSIPEAQAHISHELRKPVPNRTIDLDGRATLTTQSISLDNNRLTNSYDLSFAATAGQVTPSIHINNQLATIPHYLQRNPKKLAAASGGFFFLTDKHGAQPRQLSLNLAMAGQTLRSLPVSDKETLICTKEGLSARYLQALGELSINGARLTWAGSLTDHPADCRVYGNGNAVIKHQADLMTGNIRVLDEDSRYTPYTLPEDGCVDAGFMSAARNRFVMKALSPVGGLDIFGYDMVIRCPEAYIRGNEAEMKIHSVDSLSMDGNVQGAISVGPMLDAMSFTAHPINQDASLGSNPPFTERPMARSVAYATNDGQVHLRVFDAIPGDEIFHGVTPSEVSAILHSEAEVVWGCFLDPGQTAKVGVRSNDVVRTYGNGHYLKWPAKQGRPFLWKPNDGRPLASIISLE
jgi:hypothetical protein